MPDLDAMKRRVRRFIGRRAEPTGPEYDEMIDGVMQSVRSIAWVPSWDSPDEVPYRPEYVRECAAECLWAADQETADACGVPFDPTCGGQKPGSAPAPEPTAPASPAAKRTASVPPTPASGV